MAQLPLNSLEAIDVAHVLREGLGGGRLVQPAVDGEHVDPEPAQQGGKHE